MPTSITKLKPLARAMVCCLVGLEVLVGCAAGVSEISRNRVYGRYDVTEVQWGAGGGQDFTVVIRNNPTELSTPQFERAVIDAIQNKITFMITNFTTTPGENVRDQYRIEFFFDPPDNTNGFVLCNRNREMPQTAPRPGETYVLGAFCLRDRPLSEAFGRSVGAPPGTPAFDQLMTQMIRSLLPQFPEGNPSARCLLPGRCD